MTPEIQRHIWVMKFLTFTSQLTLPTVELISEPSNLIRRCWGKVAQRQSNHSLCLCVSLYLCLSPSLCFGPGAETGVGAGVRVWDRRSPR